MKKLTLGSLQVLPAALWLLVTAVPLYANNTTLNYNPATVNYVSSTCGSFAPYSCATSAYFNATSLDTENDGNVTLLFQDAFNAWNTSVGDTWTLVDNVAPGGGTYNITGDPEGNPNAGIPASTGNLEA
jgi:hypothetical protein